MVGHLLLRQDGVGSNPTRASIFPLPLALSGKAAGHWTQCVWVRVLQGHPSECSSEVEQRVHAPRVGDSKPPTPTSFIAP